MTKKMIVRVLHPFIYIYLSDGFGFGCIVFNTPDYQDEPNSSSRIESDQGGRSMGDSNARPLSPYGNTPGGYAQYSPSGYAPSPGSYPLSSYGKPFQGGPTRPIVAGYDGMNTYITHIIIFQFILIIIMVMHLSRL